MRRGLALYRLFGEELRASESLTGRAHDCMPNVALQIASDWKIERAAAQAKRRPARRGLSGASPARPAARPSMNGLVRAAA
jgi:hypothetical protein